MADSIFRKVDQGLNDFNRELEGRSSHPKDLDILADSIQEELKIVEYQISSMREGDPMLKAYRIGYNNRKRDFESLLELSKLSESDRVKERELRERLMKERLDKGMDKDKAKIEVDKIISQTMRKNLLNHTKNNKEAGETFSGQINEAGDLLTKVGESVNDQNTLARRGAQEAIFLQRRAYYKKMALSTILAVLLLIDFFLLIKKIIRTVR